MESMSNGFYQVALHQVTVRSNVFFFCAGLYYPNMLEVQKRTSMTKETIHERNNMEKEAIDHHLRVLCPVLSPITSPPKQLKPVVKEVTLVTQNTVDIFKMSYYMSL